MRLALPLAALALLAVPAYAQTTPPAAVPSTTSAPAEHAGAAAKPATAPAPHPRVSMGQKFSTANTTHDGHLTEDQAKTGFPAVARHFAAIDAAKKGYITEDDIRTWEKAERARRHAAQQPAAVPKKS